MAGSVGSSGRWVHGLSPVSCSAVEVQGSSVAALVCADVLEQGGFPVVLRCDEAKMGRSFRRVSLDGRRVELGARLLELDYGFQEPGQVDPRGYTYGTHADHMGLIRLFIEGLVVPVPATLTLDRGGLITPDFLLTSNLHYLRDACTPFERASIERDARQAVHDIGADGVTADRLAAVGYRVASERLHGRAFHVTFIEPFMNRILGTGADVPALLHRKIWLPLFRPGEVLDAIRGDCGRPVRSMYFGMGEAVDALIARVRPLIGRTLSRAEAADVSVIRDVPRRAADNMLLRFIWMRDDAKVPPTVWWVSGGPIFRQTSYRGIRCWELSGRSAELANWPAAIADRTVSVPLAEIGAVDTHAGIVGYGSFNEQVIQGIAAATWRMPL